LKFFDTGGGRHTSSTLENRFQGTDPSIAEEVFQAQLQIAMLQSLDSINGNNNNNDSAQVSNSSANNKHRNTLNYFELIKLKPSKYRVNKYRTTVASTDETIFADNDECSICWSDFDDNDLVVCLPCNKHTFHKECIYAWLRKKSALCPICRADVRGEELSKGYAGFPEHCYDTYEQRMLTLRRETFKKLPLDFRRQQANIAAISFVTSTVAIASTSYGVAITESSEVVARSRLNSIDSVTSTASSQPESQGESTRISNLLATQVKQTSTTIETTNTESKTTKNTNIEKKSQLKISFWGKKDKRKVHPKKSVEELSVMTTLDATANKLSSQ